ncbi:MAG: valine--tRNA ligase, partial [bacterium]|nr:valine--tRNA ligase [bacterium]
TLAKVSEREMLGHLHEKPRKAMSAVVGDIEVYLPLEGLIDLGKEKERLTRELESAQIEIAKVEKKLLNSEFMQKAPQEVVQREKTKKMELQQRRIRLQQRLEDVS